MKPDAVRSSVTRSTLVFAALFLTHPSTAQSGSWERIYTDASVTDPCELNGSGPPILNMGAGDDGTLYFSDPGRFFRSDDQGATWTRPDFQLYHIVSITPSVEGVFFVGVYGSEGGAYRLSAGGNEWQSIAIGSNVLSLAARPGTAEVYAVTDSTWLEVVRDGLHDGGPVTPTLRVSAVRTGIRGGIYARDDTGYYVSNDGANWWHVESEFFPVELPFDGLLLARDAASVYRSENDGLDWDHVLELPSASLLPTESGDAFAISEHGAVFMSIDRGASWLPVIDAFECSRRSAVMIDSVGHLVAGTNGGLIFRSTKSTYDMAQQAKALTIDRAEAPVSFSLGANYPNPFNPRTTITYSLETSGWIDLKIYDLGGRLIETLITGHIPAGDHTYVFSASGLPSGVYVYALSSGEKRESRNMVLLR